MRSGGVTLSADKTSATADSTDAVTISLKYMLNGAGVSGKTVAWNSTGGTLSTASSQTGSAGGATVKLTSDVAGTFTVTGTVEGVAKTTDEITFIAPVGE
ncbi:Ig-like domain-containing protein [Enterobacter asburiae]|uniref:Ig-like domain-containing protein n=1 Tax=Enterobacter asburiae TaxID=61645 RepID=UPI003D6DB4B0|nr:Ig-like domain-containing protein [Enterobacter asburiae]HBM7663118.1 Ig-like domain-containing protein [Enterobacter asburiae]HBM7677487.1 Ig-like domain-containing protein [Enterobacter asburiae]